MDARDAFPYREARIRSDNRAPYCLEQRDVAAAAHKAFATRYDDFERVSQVFQTSGIKRRYAARPIEWYFEPLGEISLKALLLQDAFGGAGDLFVGYTQRSFWQMYNRSASSPFRETDFEPELWLRRVVNKPFLGWNVSTVALGVNHQSNGRGDEFSRSWNRVLGSVAT